MVDLATNPLQPTSTGNTLATIYIKLNNICAMPQCFFLKEYICSEWKSQVNKPQFNICPVTFALQCPLLLLNIKETPQTDRLMMAAGHDRDNFTSQSTLCLRSRAVCVWPCHAAEKCGWSGQHIELFPSSHDKQTTQRLHRYPESRFHMLFVSLRLYIRLI